MAKGDTDEAYKYMKGETEMIEKIKELEEVSALLELEGKNKD